MNTSVSSNRWTIRTLASCMLMASLSVSITNVALPAISASLQIHFSAVQWLTLIYLLMTTVLTVTMGRLGDIWGRKQVMLAGTVLYSLGAAIGAVALNFSTLLIARCLQGVGAATLMALAVASVSEFSGTKKLGSAMGLMGTVSAIGTAMGPSVGGFLISIGGWRAVFYLMSLIGVLNLGLLSLFVPRTEQPGIQAHQKLDITGSALLMLALASYALAMTLGKGQVSISNALLLGASAVGLVLFWKFEKKTAFPLISTEVFGDRILRINLLSNATVSTVMMTTLIVGPFYLSKALDFDSAHVGLLMSLGPTMSMLTGYPAGRLVDRFGAGRISRIGLAIMFLGLAGLTCLSETYGWIGYAVSVATLSPGYQIFQAANNSEVMSKRKSEDRGVVSGLLSVSRNLGLITGAVVTSAIFNLCIGALETASREAMTFGMKTTFSFAAVLIVAALISQMYAGRILVNFKKP